MFTQPYTALRIRTQLYAVELVLRNSKRSTQQYSLYSSLQSFTQQNTVYAAEHALRNSTHFTQQYMLYAVLHALRSRTQFTQQNTVYAAVHALRSCTLFTQLYALYASVVTLRSQNSGSLYAALRSFTQLYAAKHLSFQLRKAIITLRALYARFTHTLRALYANFTCP